MTKTKELKEMTVSGDTGQYSPPMAMLKRHKLLYCKKCGNIVIDKCESCSKDVLL